MKEKLEYFKQIHTENASNISDIIESIRMYLEIIQKNAMFLEQRNSSESVNQWLYLFIESNKSIESQISIIVLEIEKHLGLLENSDVVYEELNKFIAENPQLTQDENQTQSIMNIGSSLTKTSNVKIVEILKDRLLNRNNTLYEYISHLSGCIEKYNEEIMKIEMYLTLKHYDMNPIEKYLKSLLQESELAIDMYNVIKTNNFKYISLIKILGNG